MKASGEKAQEKSGKNKGIKSNDKPDSGNMPNESTKKEDMTGYNELEEQQKVGGDINNEQLW